MEDLLEGEVIILKLNLKEYITNYVQDILVTEYEPVQGCFTLSLHFVK